MPEWFLPVIVAGILATVIFFLLLGVISESEDRRKAAFTAAKILMPVGIIGVVVKAVIGYLTRA